HRDADSFGKFGDAHLSLGQHDVDVNDNSHARSRYTVRSFSDLMSTSLCRTRSNMAAAVATTIERNVAISPIMMMGGRSSLSAIRASTTPTTTKPIREIAQYLIVRSAFTAAGEKTSLCRANVSTLKA